jgi:hypothetical protein
VEYGGDSKNPQNAAQQRVDYREILSAADYTVFDRLRATRRSQFCSDKIA